MKQSAIIAFFAAAVGWLFAKAKKPSSSSTPFPDMPTVPDGPTPMPIITEPQAWADPSAPARIMRYARPVAEALDWPGLLPFLVAVSFTESRGNSSAGSSANNNDARGWFGGRPDSMMVAERALAPNSIRHEPTAVALYIDYIYRLRRYAEPTQVADWLAVRRGGALPRLVSDVAENEPRSRDVRVRFEQALRYSGLPASFMSMPAYPPHLNYPGFDRVWQMVSSQADIA